MATLPQNLVNRWKLIDGPESVETCKVDIVLEFFGGCGKVSCFIVGRSIDGSNFQDHPRFRIEIHSYQLKNVT